MKVFNQKINFNALPKSESNDHKFEKNSLIDSTKIKFRIAGMWRIFFARFFDFLIVSILPLGLSFTINSWGKNQLWATILILVTTLIWFLIYFVLIPRIWKGKTLMKWIFRLRVITNQETLNAWMLLTRELFIVFIPWLVQLITNLIIVVVLNVNFGSIVQNQDDNSNSYKIAMTVLKIVSTFYLLWYVGLIIAILLDKHHQFFVDRRLHMYIVDTRPILNKSKTNAVKEDYVITRAEPHVHLGKEQPGNIDDTALEDINNL